MTFGHAKKGGEFGDAKGVYDLSKAVHAKSLQQVAIIVNTACSDPLATLRSMAENDTRKMQGQRLTEARKAAGYRSARAAAMENGWRESSYRAHELGTRTMGVDDAERYAKRFRAGGAKITAQGLLFGDGSLNGFLDPADVRAALEVLAYKLGMPSSTVPHVAGLLLQAIQGPQEVPFGSDRPQVVRKQVLDELHKCQLEAKAQTVPQQ